MDWSKQQETDQRPQPTVADQRSGGVDDSQVIDATLANTPMAPSRVQKMKRRMDDATGAAREYVERQPWHAALFAVAGGAALAALAFGATALRVQQKPRHIQLRDQLRNQLGAQLRRVRG